MTKRIALAVSAAILAACGSPSATIAVTVGGEPDALDGVTNVEVDAVFEPSANTQKSTLYQGPPSQAAIDLGDVAQTDVVSLQLTGTDASNDVIAFGATPFVEVGALDGVTIPLFVQKTGQLARMPGSTIDARSKPLLATSPRGVYHAGGYAADGSEPPFGGYDLLFLDQFKLSWALPSHPQSFGIVELASATDLGDIAVGVLVGDTEVDELGLPSGNVSQFADPPPNLLGWKLLSGGRTVTGDDGTAYVVGPSNPNVSSAAIFAFPPQGLASVMNLSSSNARKAAATTWVPGRGIFLYGGGGASFAEIVSSSGVETTYCATPEANRHVAWPARAAVPIDANVVLVAGDGEQPRTIDLSAGGGKECPQPWGSAQNLPPVLDDPSLFALVGGAFLLVGDDVSGATRVFRLDATSNEEKTLRIPRRGARAIQTATGEVILFGGGSTTPESYFD